MADSIEPLLSALTEEHRRGKKIATTDFTENLIQNKTLKLKATIRQGRLRALSEERASSSSIVKTESNHTEAANTSKVNKLKRKQANKSHQQVDTFELSSDEEIAIEKKSKNCIASRTRSKAQNSDKKSNSPIHTSTTGTFYE